MKDEDPKQDRDHLDDHAQWKDRYEADQGNPQEQFRQVTHIALNMSYDLIDKLRWWEKHTLELSDDEIAKRIPHMAKFLDQLRVAYLEFTDVDF